MASTVSAMQPKSSCQAVKSRGSPAAVGHFFDSTAVIAQTAPADTASRLPVRLVSSQGATISTSPANASATAIHWAPRMRSWMMKWAKTIIQKGMVNTSTEVFPGPA